MIIEPEGIPGFCIIGKVYLLSEDNKKTVAILKLCALGPYYNHPLPFSRGFG